MFRPSRYLCRYFHSQLLNRLYTVPRRQTPSVPHTPDSDVSKGLPNAHRKQVAQSQSPAAGSSMGLGLSRPSSVCARRLRGSLPGGCNANGTIAEGGEDR
jgi:hypothetical protein